MFVQLLNQAYHKTIGLLERALDIRSEQHRSTTANIANQDTPMYKATEVNFKAAIRDASGRSMSGPMAVTNPMHFPSTAALGRTNVKHLPGESVASTTPSYIVESKNKSVRLDGNNVRAEQEMAKLAENTLMYNATVQIVGGKLASLKNTIRDLR